MQVPGGGKAKGAAAQIALLRRRTGKMNLSWQTAVMPRSKQEKVLGDEGAA